MNTPNETPPPPEPAIAAAREIERYDLMRCDGESGRCRAKMEQSHDGEYVSWADFAPLRAELERLREERDSANQRAGAYYIDLAQICADNDIKALPCQQPRFIGECMAQLRSDLKTAKERVAEGEKALNEIVCKAEQYPREQLTVIEEGCYDIAKSALKNRNEINRT